mmetsp:Transcript_18419/g.38559  ORF Transcript_18419/g.38559 Transcript_18419/m.38559 type:complete len:106 (-) Transcript_18419:3298-3615(-)
MLLDPHRHSYEQYGMNRSFKSSYSPSTLLFYLRSYWRGEYRLRSTEEDATQLGGDFVVGQDGKIILAHPSQTPIDRESPEQLVSALLGTTAESEPLTPGPVATEV